MRATLLITIFITFSCYAFASTDPNPFKEEVKEAIKKASDFDELEGMVDALVEKHRMEDDKGSTHFINLYLREISMETGIRLEYRKGELKARCIRSIASDKGYLEYARKLTDLPEIYIKLDDALKQAKNKWPLLLINGHLISGSIHNIDAGRVISHTYVAPEKAKRKYGDIAYGGVIVMELSDFDKDEVDRYGILYKAGKKIKSPKNKGLDQVSVFSDCKGLTGEEAALCTKERFNEYIASTMQYPKEAKEMGIEGVVNVRFTITERGRIGNPVALNDLGGNTAREAIFLIQNMNYLVAKWTPAVKNGKAVMSSVTMPIQFSLEGEISKKPFSATSEANIGGETVVPLPQVIENQMLGNELIKYLFEFEIMPRPIFVVNGEILEKDSVQLDHNRYYSLNLLDEDKAAIKYETVNQRALEIGPGAKPRTGAISISETMPQSDVVKEEHFIQEMNIFPNPAKIKFTLEFRANAAPMQIAIHDAAGKVLYQENIPDFDGVYSKTIERQEFVNTHAVISFTQDGKVQTKQLIFAE